jgi:hypothetical protein
MYLSAANTLDFATNTTNRLTISSTGNVGIGTSSPAAKLHVLTNSGVSSLFETQAGLLPTYQYRRSGASLANLTNGDAVASMDFIARANSSWLTIAQIYAEYSGNGTTQTGNLQFYTANAGSIAERMRITSGGDLLVGWTGGTYNDPNFLNVVGITLRGPGVGTCVIVNSTSTAASIGRKTTTGTIIDFSYNGSAVGTITTNGSTITFSGNALSDNRYKDNIETISNAVDAINKVDWVTFKYKDNKRASAGVTAQQLQTVPELLKFVIDGIDEDSYKAVDYNAIIGYLGAAIKEQNQTIQNLQEQINILAK